MKNQRISGKLSGLAGLLAVSIALLGCETPKERVSITSKTVNLRASLSTPRFVNGLIECRDTIYNAGPDSSTPTLVYFYLGPNYNDTKNNRKLLKNGTGANSQNVGGRSAGIPADPRDALQSLYDIPSPRPKGLQYLVAEVIPNERDSNYSNNVASVQIDFGP